MKELFIFYVIFTYLFELGALPVYKGSNWWNFLLAPIIVPFKLGMYYATQMLK